MSPCFSARGGARKFIRCPPRSRPRPDVFTVTAIFDSNGRTRDCCFAISAEVHRTSSPKNTTPHDAPHLLQPCQPRLTRRSPAHETFVAPEAAAGGRIQSTSHAAPEAEHAGAE